MSDNVIRVEPTHGTTANDDDDDESPTGTTTTTTTTTTPSILNNGDEPLDDEDEEDEELDEAEPSELEPLSSSAHVEHVNADDRTRGAQGEAEEPSLEGGAGVGIGNMPHVSAEGAGAFTDEAFPGTLKLVSDARLTIQELLNKHEVMGPMIRRIWCQFAYDYNQASLGFQVEVLLEHKATGRRFELLGDKLRELLDVDHDNYVQFYGIYDKDLSAFNVYLQAFNTDFVVLPGDAVILDMYPNLLDESEVDLETDYMADEFLKGIAEVLERVWSFVDSDTLVSCSMVCKYWRQLLMENDELWKQTCVREGLWTDEYDPRQQTRQQTQYYDQWGSYLYVTPETVTVPTQRYDQFGNYVDTLFPKDHAQYVPPPKDPSVTETGLIERWEPPTDFRLVAIRYYNARRNVPALLKLMGSTDLANKTPRDGADLVKELNTMGMYSIKGFRIPEDVFYYLRLADGYTQMGGELTCTNVASGRFSMWNRTNRNLADLYEQDEALWLDTWSVIDNNWLRVAESNTNNGSIFLANCDSASPFFGHVVLETPSRPGFIMLPSFTQMLEYMALRRLVFAAPSSVNSYPSQSLPEFVAKHLAAHLLSVHPDLNLEAFANGDAKAAAAGASSSSSNTTTTPPAVVDQGAGVSVQSVEIESIASDDVVVTDAAADTDIPEPPTSTTLPEALQGLPCAAEFARLQRFVIDMTGAKTMALVETQTTTAIHAVADPETIASYGYETSVPQDIASRAALRKELEKLFESSGAQRERMWKEQNSTCVLL